MANNETITIEYKTIDGKEHHATIIGPDNRQVAAECFKALIMNDCVDEYSVRVLVDGKDDTVSLAFAIVLNDLM